MSSRQELTIKHLLYRKLNLYNDGSQSLSGDQWYASGSIVLDQLFPAPLEQLLSKLKVIRHSSMQLRPQPTAWLGETVGCTCRQRSPEQHRTSLGQTLHAYASPEVP